jgi:5-methylcytosine-specific restriction endonuclease McrA
MKVCIECGEAALAKELCAKHYHAAKYLRRKAVLPSRPRKQRAKMSPEQHEVARKTSVAKHRAANPRAAAAYTKKWRDAHPEYAAVRRVRQLDYAAKNREQEAARAAKWRAEHPEKATSGKRAYYLKNIAKVRASTKAHRLENRSRYLEYSKIRKGAKRAGGGRLTKGIVKKLLTTQRGLCVACRCDLSVSGHHIDHIKAVSKGGLHCDENVQLLCPTCNRRQSDKDFSDFLRIIHDEWVAQSNGA